MRAALAIGLAMYLLLMLGGAWLLADMATRPTVIQVPAEVEPEPAYTCDLSPPERPDLAARLDTIRCIVQSLAELTSSPRWVRKVTGTADNHTITRVVGTRAIPGSFDWRGWPDDWNLCEVCGAGWGCNRR